MRADYGAAAPSVGWGVASNPGAPTFEPAPVLADRVHYPQGADVVTHHTDSTAAVQAAEAKKVYAVAYHSDMSKYGPNAHLTAVTHNWGEYYTRTAQAALDGKWKSESPWMGIKEGVIRMAPFNKAVPQDVQDLVKKTEADIKAGKFHPFTGPIKDRDGKDRVAAGATATDEELHKMDWYVVGVQG